MSGSAVSSHLGVVPPPLLIPGFSSGSARVSLCPCGSRYPLVAWALPSRLAPGSGFALVARATRSRLGLCPRGLRYALAAWASCPRGLSFALTACSWLGLCPRRSRYALAARALSSWLALRARGLSFALAAHNMRSWLGLCALTAHATLRLGLRGNEKM